MKISCDTSDDIYTDHWIKIVSEFLRNNVTCPFYGDSWPILKSESV